MKALVVYDSFFGNTERIAQAIGDALASQGEVATLRVADVKPQHLAGIQLLVVGSPTRAFKPSPAITAWLNAIPANGLKGMKVAAFDTRMAVDEINSAILHFMSKLAGFAADPISKKLVKKGGEEAIPRAGFIVNASEGPLREGEIERAAAWARQIIAGQ